MKREAKFGILFRHWIKAHPPRVTTHYELKQTTGNCLPFSAFETHQEIYGNAIQQSDQGVLMRNVGGNGEPDYTYTFKDPVVIAIKFPKFFCLIPFDTFVVERNMSQRKSLTIARALIIAEKIVRL